MGMWESRRDFQVLWADAVSVHQDGISIGRGEGVPGEGRAKADALYDALRAAQGVS